MMGGATRWLLVGALVAGSSVPASPLAAQSAAEVARARQTLEDYFACERTQRFAPCWSHLSERIRAEWAGQGRGTVTEYAEARGAAARRYSDFRVLRIRRSPSRVVFVVEATRSGDHAGPPDRVEYAVRREGAQWRIDGRRVGQWETTP